MRRRLGEQLVDDGVISQTQLQQALAMQRQLGGRLGTNLIEGAALGEGDLLRALGNHHGTRTATRQQLESIAAAAIRLLPGKLAQRYQLVPYELQGKTLLIASADVVDAITEDEIRMLTGHMVRTAVALELRVKLALQQFYRVPCGVRFTSLAKRIDSGTLRPGARQEPRQTPSSVAEDDEPIRPRGPSLARAIPVQVPAAPKPSSETASPRTSPATPTSSEWTPKPDTTSPTRPSFARRQPVAPVPPPPRHSPPAPAKAMPPRPAPAKPLFIELDDEDAELLRSMRDDADPMPVEVPLTAPPEDVGMGTVDVWDPGDEDSSMGHDASFEEDAPPMGDPPPMEEGASPKEDTDTAAEWVEPRYDDPALSLEERLDVAAAALQGADIRDEIADVLLGFAAPYLERRLLLFRRQERIIGWRGEGPGVVAQALRAVEVQSHEPSVFTSLTEASSMWLGPLPPLEPNQRLVAGLGGAAPKDCLVLPLVLRGKIVCYLYGDNRQESVSGAPLAELRRLLAKAGMAFEIYILKNKMRLL